MLIALSSDPACGQRVGTGSGLGAWQNPDLGFVMDLKWDLHDAERDEKGRKIWTTRGLELSSAELSIGHEIDPYGRIDFNAFFSEEGAEIHELFFLLPALPLNLSLKGGHYLARFGRWSQFHSHSMPFASEPRILHEYLEGHLAPTGLELSWLLPISHYVELTGGVYNSIVGHSHDTDPVSESAAWGPGNPPPGCHFHGDRIHCPGNPDLEELYYSLVSDPEGPTRSKTNRGFDDLAYLGRLKSSVEFGLSWSVDLGASVIHQENYAYSQRFEGRTYSKTTAGADVTVFWTPPEMNLYRGMDFGFELLVNDEQFETVGQDGIVQEDLKRAGLFGHVRYRHNRRWSFGAFGETFEPRKGADDGRDRLGGFLTWNISHFQYVTLEFSRYDRSPFEDPVNSFTIQYDGVIGYHTHGSQR
jgi:hypothetical protein